MNINYLMPLSMVIICNVCYHLISKNITSTTNTFIALFITYGVTIKNAMGVGLCIMGIFLIIK